MQGIPTPVVSTVNTETSFYEPLHPLGTAGASCSSNTGDGVSVALREVHDLLQNELTLAVDFNISNVHVSRYSLRHHLLLRGIVLKFNTKLLTMFQKYYT